MFMELELSKIDVAVDQLDWAICLFLDHKACVAAITLAGAAEEILGQAVGERAAFKVLKTKFVSEHDVYGLSESAISQDHLNRAKNWFKHWDLDHDHEKMVLELDEGSHTNDFARLNYFL